MNNNLLIEKEFDMIKSWYEAVDGLYKQDKAKFLKLVDLKADILTDLIGKDDKFTNVLIMGFNPMLWKICKDDHLFKYSMVCYDPSAVEFVRQHEDLKHIDVYHISEIQPAEQFDVVMALDSWFTFFSTESAQRDAISLAYAFTKHTLITTVKDFKNMKSADRLIDPPMVINSKEGNHVFVCHREWSPTDKQQFDETMYQLNNEDIVSCIKEQKRTLYFKQLAKYVHDLGCREFKISQQHFYKNLFSRSYEYIATAKK